MAPMPGTPNWQKSNLEAVLQIHFTLSERSVLDPE